MCPAGTRKGKRFYGDEVAKGRCQASSSAPHYDIAQNTPATYYGTTGNTLGTDVAAPGFTDTTAPGFAGDMSADPAMIGAGIDQAPPTYGNDIQPAPTIGQTDYALYPDIIKV